MADKPNVTGKAANPWTVTLVQAQLDEMAGACNELHAANREIKFIVPISQMPERDQRERQTAYVAIFSFSVESTVGSNK